PVDGRPLGSRSGRYATRPRRGEPLIEILELNVQEPGFALRLRSGNHHSGRARRGGGLGRTERKGEESRQNDANMIAHGSILLKVAGRPPSQQRLWTDAGSRFLQRPLA